MVPGIAGAIVPRLLAQTAHLWRQMRMVVTSDPLRHYQETTRKYFLLFPFFPCNIASCWFMKTGRWSKEESTASAIVPLNLYRAANGQDRVVSHVR